MHVKHVGLVFMIDPSFEGATMKASSLDNVIHCSDFS